MRQEAVDESIRTMQGFAEGFAEKSPTEQRVDQQIFILAFTAGLLQEMTPSPEGYSESAGLTRYLANLDMRARIHNFIDENPDLSPLEWLKHAVQLLDVAYEELQEIDSIFKNERTIAHNVRIWVHDRTDLIDDAFARMALDHAGIISTDTET